MLTIEMVEKHKENLNRLSRKSLVNMFIWQESTIFDPLTEDDIKTISKDTLVWMLTVNKYGWYELREIYGLEYMLGL